MGAQTGTKTIGKTQARVMFRRQEDRKNGAGSVENEGWSGAIRRLVTMGFNEVGEGKEGDWERFGEMWR